MKQENSDSRGVAEENSKYSRPIDKLTGVEVDNSFERFEQKNDIYCRSLWDERVINDKSQKFFEGYYMPYARARKTDGFTQKDYAFRNASWHVCNVMRDIEKSGEFRKEKPDEIRKEGFWDYFTSHDKGWPEPYPFADAGEATRDVRRVAEFFGVGALRVCEYDNRWMYETTYNADGSSKPQEIPDDIPNVIITAEPMDLGLIGTVPSALSGAATGLGYTYDTVAILALTQYIRNLGYRAYASLNDSALAIPLALQAGMGEVGRNGLLISKEYGPRLRLGKIFTDMPLEHDAPVKMGIEEFCDICDRCAEACPPRAVPFGPPQVEIHSESNIKGVKKWTPIAEKCFKFWSSQNTDCTICIRVCPYNRDFSKWLNRLWFWLAGSRFRELALKLDDWLIDRGRQKSVWWWRPELKEKENKKKKPRKKRRK